MWAVQTWSLGVAVHRSVKRIDCHFLFAGLRTLQVLWWWWPFKSPEFCVILTCFWFISYFRSVIKGCRCTEPSFCLKRTWAFDITGNITGNDCSKHLTINSRQTKTAYQRQFGLNLFLQALETVAAAHFAVQDVHIYQWYCFPIIYVACLCYGY